ncbi:MAG: hypothetical protein EA412_05305, partial [Chitinophagaceae bacterium]
HNEKKRTLFQSFFSWIMVWKMYDTATERPGNIMFQSFFSWIMVWKSPDHIKVIKFYFPAYF